jgi:hypothetical protein
VVGAALKLELAAELTRQVPSLQATPAAPASRCGTLEDICERARFGNIAAHKQAPAPLDDVLPIAGRMRPKVEMQQSETLKQPDRRGRVLRDRRGEIRRTVKTPEEVSRYLVGGAASCEAACDSCGITMDCLACEVVPSVFDYAGELSTDEPKEIVIFLGGPPKPAINRHLKTGH